MGLYQNDEFLEVKLLGEKIMCAFKILQDIVKLPYMEILPTHSEMCERAYFFFISFST